MYLLIQLAKGIANGEGAAAVSLDHIRNAVCMLELERDDGATRVLEYLGVAPPPSPTRVDQLRVLLAHAQAGRRLPMDEQAKDFLRHFGNDLVFYRIPALLGKVGNEQSTSGATHKAISEEGESTPASGGAGTSESPTDVRNPFDPSMAWPDRITLVQQLQQFLQERLYDQGEVIDQLADGVIQKALRGERNGPLACLLMVGPPATGKTHTAQLLVEALGPHWKSLQMDMSTLQSPNQGFALTGMSRGYSDARPGELTSFVRENPRSVIVLDNLHKAHPSNQDVLQAVFDTGFLTDQFGFYPNNDLTKPQLAMPQVDFRNTILIFTTNAGAGTLQNPDFLAYLHAHPEESKDAVFDLLSKQTNTFARSDGEQAVFAPDLLSRLSAQMLLLYRPLSLPALERIARNSWDSYVDSLQRAFHANVDAHDLEVLLRMAVLSFGSQLDARKVGGAALEALLFGGVIDKLQEAKTVLQSPCIRFELRDGTSAEFDKCIEMMGGSKDIVREMSRKQRALDFDLDTRLHEDGCIWVELSSPRWVTPVRSSDLFGIGRIAVSVPDVSFDDIAGQELAKARLREVARLLNQPTTLKAWNISMPRGMLLYGAPGTGKTMLAKALANEADLPFLNTSGPDLLDARQMHQVFERARHYAPAILFIDEAEVIGSRERGDFAIPINQLLTELDGFSSHSGGVFVVMASNFPQKLDPAILRAGRVDMHVEVLALDPPARRHFFDKLHALPGGSALDVDLLIQSSGGMTGAELEQVRRDASIHAIRSGRGELSQEDLLEHINIVRYGERLTPEKSREKHEAVAWHEAGHALVAMVLRPEVAVEQATIVARRNAEGFVSYDPNGMVSRAMNRNDVLADIAICLAARTSQEIRYGDAGIDAGASSDLQQATRLAEMAVCQWGLDEVIGHRVLTKESMSWPAEAALVGARVQEWVRRGKQQALEVLQSHRDALEQLANALLEQETMSSDSIRDVIERFPSM